MPKASPKESADADSELPFEEALAQLEELVGEMESDQMPLEALIESYEKGTHLFQVCEKRLDEAEGRIEIIRKNRNGEAVVEPFDSDDAPLPESSGTPEEDTDDEESSDNGELF